MEVMTLAEVAAFLKLKPTQVYGLTRRRTQSQHEHPLPVFKLGKHLRFMRSDVEAWLKRLSGGGK